MSGPRSAVPVERRSSEQLQSMNTMKSALITGSSSGIGQALALILAASGYEVFLGGRNPQKLQALADQIARQGGRAWLCPADLSDEAGCIQVAEQVQAQCQKLDVLVHSAGCFKMGAFTSLPVEDLDQQYRINLRAPYLLTQLLLPLLKTCAGQVVFINSTAALTAGAQWGAYSATKAGLKALADALRAEVNPFGMRVISCFPGRTATPMQKDIHQQEGRPYHEQHLMQPEDVAQMVVQALSLPYTAEVLDMVIRPLKKRA